MSVLANRKIPFEEIDISDPQFVSEKNFMREHSHPTGSDPTPLPPQIFNDDVYCGVSCLYFTLILFYQALKSGDWLLTLTISACSLRVDGKAVCLAVALHLGIDLGKEHVCCGANVDPVRSSLVWYAMMASGQTAVLACHGVVASPSHSILRGGEYLHTSFIRRTWHLVQ